MKNDIRKLLYGPFIPYEEKFFEIEKMLFEGIWTTKKDFLSILYFFEFNNSKHINFFEKMPIFSQELLCIKVFNSSNKNIHTELIQNKNNKSFFIIDTHLKEIRKFLENNKRYKFFIKIENEDENLRNSFITQSSLNKYSIIKTSNPKKSLFIENFIVEMGEKKINEEFKTFFWHKLPPATRHLDEFFISDCFSKSRYHYEYTRSMFKIILNKKRGAINSPSQD